MMTWPLMPPISESSHPGTGALYRASQSHPFSQQSSSASSLSGNREHESTALGHGSWDAVNNGGNITPPLDSQASDASSRNAEAFTKTERVPAASRQNSAGSNLFACRNCGRSYSRPEHLVRHVQTHTLGRRFSCEICTKSFARKDLLRRHVANHQNDSAKKRRKPSTVPTEGRVSHACRACATARVKCDDTKPCKRCVGRNVECVSSEAGSAAAMHLMHLSETAHYNDGKSVGPFESTRTPSISDTSSSSRSSTHPQGLSPVGFLPNHLLPENDFRQVSERTPPEEVSPRHSGGTPDIANVMSRPPGSSPGTAQGMAHEKFRVSLQHLLYGHEIHNSPGNEEYGKPYMTFFNPESITLTDADLITMNMWGPVHPEQRTSWSHMDSVNGSNDVMQVAATNAKLLNIWATSPWRRSGNMDIEANNNLSAETEEELFRLIQSACNWQTDLHTTPTFLSSGWIRNTLQLFLTVQASETSRFIHYPTLNLQDQKLEWLAAAVAVGAMKYPAVAWGRFSYALAEYLRHSLPSRLAQLDGSILDLSMAQALLLCQGVLVWSGNRRNVENAIPFLLHSIMMMRFRGKFQRSAFPPTKVDPSDEGQLLESKWRQWVEKEQWKRVIAQCSIVDAQISMITLVSPLISYYEMRFPLPESPELWHASSAQEWKHRYLAIDRLAHPLPSIGDTIYDGHQMSNNYSRLDVQLCVSVHLLAAWALVLEYRQLSAVHRSPSYANDTDNEADVVMGARYSQLVQRLGSFTLLVFGWPEMSPREHVVWRLLELNLHVSIEDVRTFAGKDGIVRAREVYLMLLEWTERTESRSALWCAGQILRFAKEFPPGHLRDFYAIAVFYASWVLWTFSVICRARDGQHPAKQHNGEVVYLDGPDSIAISRYISLGRGRPVLQYRRSSKGQHEAPAEAALSNPVLCMEVVRELLRANHAQEPLSVPASVEHVRGLLEQLGNAAWALGMG